MVAPLMLAAVGAGTMAIGGLMASKGRRPQISPEQLESIRRKSEVEGTLTGMFQERAKDPFKYVMPLSEQKYYDERRDEIYGEGRKRQEQGLMGAMSRTGALGSGQTNYALSQFSQQTMRQQQQFYFEDRRTRLQEREGAVQATYGMGMNLLGAPDQGQALTEAANARARQHNVWRNRWSNMVTQAGGAAFGYGLGKAAG